MGLRNYIRQFVMKRIDGHLDKKRDETDALFDEIERSGKPLEMSDEEWRDFMAQRKNLQSKNHWNERDEQRFQRMMRLAGRSV